MNDFSNLLMRYSGWNERYVTGEVSSIVMKADERIIEQRVLVESVETLLKDNRIGHDLREEIRGHFFFSQSSNVVDQTSLFKYSACKFMIMVLTNADVQPHVAWP